MSISELQNCQLKELYQLAVENNIKNYSKLNKKELIFAILKARAESDNLFFMEGILEVLNQGEFGFLRPINYSSSSEDIYISQSQIRRFGLRNGDKVTGRVRPPQANEKFYGLLRIEAVNGMDPETAKERVHFPALTPIYPNEKIVLEHDSKNIASRLIDLVAPIGFGQRGLIVAPPKAGKTSLLKTIANSIKKNHKDVELIILLIDERPEEVTDFEREVDAEVVYSTFDKLPSNHIKISELVLERAMRLAEHKKDVIILMDSITRLSRAYNLSVPSSGKVLSGGLDPKSLYKPKQFFGAARNIEEGGSITIIATALVETGSKMDDVIYEEFKGTGNSELHLDRRLAQRRIYPAVDILKSGTRKEELLLNEAEINMMYNVRKTISNTSHTEQYIEFIKNTKTNMELIEALKYK
ncbi:transcription termination factor Rho [Mycoplasmatota bacterium]|nr:transcription termination factor Rho [Mycoplasmatota bacterium]